jgi:hypothetical protein
MLLPDTSDVFWVPDEEVVHIGIDRDRNTALLLWRDVLAVVIYITLDLLPGNESRLSIIVNILICSHGLGEAAPVG